MPSQSFQSCSAGFMPIGLVLVGACAGLHAQDASAEGEDARLALQRPPALGFFVSGGASWSGGAELDSDGEIGVARLGADVGLSYRLSDTSGLIVSIGSELSYYDFDDAAGIIPGLPGVDEPWDDVQETTLSVMYRSAPETGWNWIVGGSLTVAGESGADFGDSLLGGGFVIASYDISESLRLGLGIGASTQLDDDVQVIPVPYVEWDVTESLSIGTQERGLGATYTLDDHWKLGLNVSFIEREYRLDDDNAVSGGYFSDQRVPVELSVTYAPSYRTSFTARVGSEVWGQLEINDGSDRELINEDLSPSLLVGFDLRIAF